VNLRRITKDKPVRRTQIDVHAATVLALQNDLRNSKLSALLHKRLVLMTIQVAVYRRGPAEQSFRDLSASAIVRIRISSGVVQLGEDSQCFHGKVIAASFTVVLEGDIYMPSNRAGEFSAHRHVDVEASPRTNYEKGFSSKHSGLRNESILEVIQEPTRWHNVG
jgi:hypothetical protein